jgi:lipoprotein-anchoring transpeptidase ErfK/SrfK
MATGLGVAAGALVPLALLGLSTSAGCSSKPDANAVAADAAPAPSPIAKNPRLHDEAADGGVVATRDAAAIPTIQLGALYLETPIMSDMEWKKKDEDKKPGEKDRVIRIGYLRRGARVAAFPEVHHKSNCAEGWYELRDGGFVCGKYATTDMNHPTLRLSPHMPDMNAALPYQYGYNMTNGTPLYRSIPSREERIKLEPWLAARPKPKPKPRDDEDDDDGDAGLQTTLTGARVSSGLTGASTGTANDPLGTGSGEPTDTPWYLKDYDGGKPQVSLDDLKGEGPIARRMVKGFFLALDKSFGSDISKSRWWRTTGGLLAPYDRIYVHQPPTDFHGIWLIDSPTTALASFAGADAGAATAPTLALVATAPAAPNAAATPPAAAASVHKSELVGFVESRSAHRFTISADHKSVVQGQEAPRFTTARLTGETLTIPPNSGNKYDETEDGWWFRERDGTVTNPGPPPADLAPNEKWIDVNLKNQTLVAFEGTKAVYATLVSSGKRSNDKEKDHPTVQGSFRIREKHIAATMDGDVASDGPYSIEDVPWIQYFQGSYALHGAFWHADFGHEHSHGCVNLAPWDARALFGWTEPHLPEGWHGVVATAEDPGTRVIVHD